MSEVQQSPPPPSRPLARAIDWARQSGWRTAIEMLVNFVLPLVIFNLAKPHLGEVKALLASSAPPIIWALYELVRERRVDFISMFVLFGIALGLLAMLGGGGVKFLQLRERMVTAVIGLAFIGSALIDRPLIYEFARASMKRSGSAELERIEGLRADKGFRAFMRKLTLVWGCGLLVEAAVAVGLVFALSIPQYMIASPILGYSTAGLLGGWTFLQIRGARRAGDARRAAEAAQPAKAPQSEGPVAVLEP